MLSSATKFSQLSLIWALEEKYVYMHRVNEKEKMKRCEGDFKVTHQATANRWSLFSHMSVLCSAHFVVRASTLAL